MTGGGDGDLMKIGNAAGLKINGKIVDD